MAKDGRKLAKILGVALANPQLLHQALIHRSYINEHSDKKLTSNERLEFLGDAILSFCVSDLVYRQFGALPEGTLTNLRSRLVETKTLARLARKLKLGDYLLLSKGEASSGGADNPSLLANTFEAVVGAVYLDRGSDQVFRLISKYFVPEMKRLVTQGVLKDYKSLLQEKVQAERHQSPTYQVISELGPDHAKVFTVSVVADGKRLAIGAGRSKQEAEQEGARLALEKLGESKVK